MRPNFADRRATLKFAGLITLAASSGLRWIPAHGAALKSRGYGTDPNLLKRTITWARTLSPKQLAALAALSDIVLPAKAPHPSALALGIHHFLDEWISAPYSQMRADRVVILGGLKALDNIMLRNHNVTFELADRERQSAAFDALCCIDSTAPFARRLVELSCGGYYTTREGHAAIGYVGNIPLSSFPGPTPEVLQRLTVALGKLPDYVGPPF